MNLITRTTGILMSNTPPQKPASLQRRILYRIVPLTIALFSLVVFFASKSVSTTVQNETQRRVDELAVDQAVATNAKISLVQEACRAVAENDLVINGVVDLEHRVSTTRAFFQSLRLPGSSVQSIAMTDYRGRFIAGNHSKQNFDDREWLPAVMSGKEVVSLEGTNLIIAIPIRYSGRPEAVVVSSFPLSEFLSSLLPRSRDNSIAYLHSGSVIATSDPSAIPTGGPLVTPQNWQVAVTDIRQIPGLRVALFESETIAMQAASALRTAMLAVTAVLLLGMLGSIYWMSQLVTAPLAVMLKEIERVEDTGDMDSRVPTSSTSEFAVLGDRFNGMLRQLQQTTVSSQLFRESEQRLDVALKGGNIGLWDWDLASDQVYFSPTYKTQLGYPSDLPWTGFSEWKSRVHPEDLDETMLAFDDYFHRRKDHFEATFRMRACDDSFYWIKSKGTAEFDASGAPVRMVGLHLDVSDQILRETSLQQSNAELEQFAFVASHDLQEPLRKVSSFCQLLEEELGDSLTDDPKTYLTYVVDGTERMQTLIRDLLSFSRVRSQGQPLQETDSEIALSDALSDLAMTVTESEAVITWDTLPVVWAAPQPLSQLFQNLVGNALKYCDDTPAQIHIDCREDASEFVFGVKDNGIGIAPEFHERVFGIFKRLHGRDEYEGTGIGLAICRRIVERWDGAMRIESRPNEGSTFFFSVPKRNLRTRELTSC